MSVEQKLIDIGTHSLFRKHGTRFMQSEGECLHARISADDHGEVITCRDCGKQVSAYWAFMRFSEQYRRQREMLDSREKAVKASEEKGLILKAAQRIERAWRSQTMVPVCPHCGHTVTPADNLGGSMVGKSFTRLHEVKTERTEHDGPGTSEV